VMTLPASKGLAQQVRVGEPDPSLTRHAGLTAVDLMCRKLDVGALLGAHIAPVKQRARGALVATRPTRCCWDWRTRS